MLFIYILSINYFMNEDVQYIHCVSKKRHPFYICYNLIRCHPILSILGRNILQEIWVLQGTVRTYKTRYELGMYMCLFQISWGMFLPKISRIGWHL